MRLRVGLFVSVGLVVAACSSTGGSKRASAGAGSGDGGTLPDGAPAGDDGSGSGDDGSGTTNGPGMTSTRETMDVNGVTRSYILSVPATYDASRAYPLVMVFHGNPGTADAMLTTYPFDGASKQDAVIAYPSGTDNNWDLYTPAATNADFPFIQALPGEIATKVHLDTTRVFGSGYSGGAFFLNQLACFVPGVVKAFASHSGGAPAENGTPPEWPNGCVKCTGNPTPALLLHGTADSEVDPSGTAYAASCWATTNSCSSTDPTTWPTTTPSPCVKDTACGSSAPVELCLIPGIGHVQWSQGTLTAWSFFQSIK